MSTHVLALIDERRDTLRGTLLLSVILHAVLFVVVVTYTMIGFHLGGVGREWGAAGAVRMGAVASLPGIPLPAPMLTTPGTVATENTGLTKTEPQSKEELPPDTRQIPKFKDAVKPEKLERVNKRIQKNEFEPPPNAVPYGLKGAPTMSYTQVVTSGGQGGISIGGGNSFGQRYGYYVAAMRSRISANWLLSTVSPNIVSAPRAYLTFEILRDGTVTGVEMTQGSGIAEVDRSALRAILASSPLPPLPADYAGSNIKVEFYFDFHRQ
jgi:TonB family protein